MKQFSLANLATYVSALAIVIRAADIIPVSELKEHAERKREDQLLATRDDTDNPGPLVAGIAWCNATSCGAQCGGSTKRSRRRVPRQDGSRTSTPPVSRALEKRILNPSDLGMSNDTFMVTYTAPDPPPGVVQVNSGLGDGNSAYSKLGQDKVQFAISTITGCTAVVLVSPTAVWIGVLFQRAPSKAGAISTPDETFTEEFWGSSFTDGYRNLAFKGPAEANFLTIATNWLKGSYPGVQVSLPSVKSDFNVPDSFGLIMTPKCPYENLQAQNPLRYPQQVYSLANLISQQSGMKMENIYTKSYDAERAASYIGSQQTSGKLLYLYDPTVPKEQRLWMENYEFNKLPKPR